MISVYYNTAEPKWEELSLFFYGFKTKEKSNLQVRSFCV